MLSPSAMASSAPTGFTSAPTSPSTLGQTAMSTMISTWMQAEELSGSADFRGMAPSLHQTPASHFIYPYPGKLIPHIPRVLLNWKRAVALPPGVFDPCCGSGTVLVEALLAAEPVVGFDINPLAALISRVKCRPIPYQQLQCSLQEVASQILSTTPKVPEVVNLHYWFTEAATAGLGALRAIIDGIEDDGLRDFHQLVLAHLVRQVSLADPRMPVPVRPNLQRIAEGSVLHGQLKQHLSRAIEPDFQSLLLEVGQRIAGCIQCLPPRRSHIEVRVADARTEEVGRQFGLVLTSPPYGSAQKYIRSSSLALCWLDLAQPKDLSHLESASIGREHIRTALVQVPPLSSIASACDDIAWAYSVNPTRAHIAAEYVKDLDALLLNVKRHMAPGGAIALVMGDGTLLGRPFPITQYAIDLALSHNLSIVMDLHDRIRGRGLLTKRRADGKAIREERILIFREAK